ncbi:MAG: TraR/DksA C4-type zinc finger protein [Patescibacteria group bacterium]|jgi:RNA polymerase-binding transcription factor DksA
MDSHYSTEFLNARKADLERQKGELENQLHQIARYDNASGSWVTLQPEFDSGTTEDVGDRSDEAQTLEENQAQVAELEKSLVETDYALAKFADGSYGKCETTGDWLDEARLVAYPAARICTDD